MKTLDKTCLFDVNCSKEKEINELREGTPSYEKIDKIIELSRYSGVEVAPFELYNSRVQSYDGVNFGGMVIDLRKIKGKSFQEVYCSGGEIRGGGDGYDFSKAYFENVTWNITMTNVNFSDATLKGAKFSGFEIPYVKSPSDFSNVNIVGGILSGEFRLFNCKSYGIRANDDEIIKKSGKEFVVCDTTPRRHFRCKVATDYHKVPGQDKVKVSTVRIRLSGEEISAFYSRADEFKGSLIFKENIQFGADSSNIVMKDCFYDIQTDRRWDFFQAVKNHELIDLRDDSVRLRFVRPIFKAA